MSAIAMGIALNTKGLTSAEFAVFVAVCEAHNPHTGLCQISHKYICELAGCSKRNLPRLLATLEEKGLIRQESAELEGMKLPNNYFITGTEEGIKEVEKATKLSQIRDDWLPDEQRIAYARKKGFGGELSDFNSPLSEAVQAFIGHHQKKGSKMVSWQGAFVTWCINGAKFKAQDDARNQSAEVPELNFDEE